MCNVRTLYIWLRVSGSSLLPIELFPRIPVRCDLSATSVHEHFCALLSDDSMLQRVSCTSLWIDTRTQKQVLLKRLPLTLHWCVAQCNRCASGNSFVKRPMWIQSVHRSVCEDINRYNQIAPQLLSIPCGNRQCTVLSSDTLPSVGEVLRDLCSWYIPSALLDVVHTWLFLVSRRLLQMKWPRSEFENQLFLLCQC